MILWLIILIISISLVLFFFIKKRETFVITNTNPDNNNKIIDVSNSVSLLQNYSLKFNFEELIGNIVRDNTYYNSLMFQNIDMTQLDKYINDMNIENKKLNDIITLFNTNNIPELNKRLKDANINYTWNNETNVDTINKNYNNLLSILQLSMPDYIKNNNNYNYTNNLWFYNNINDSLNFASSIANNIILGFDNLKTSNITSSNNIDKLNYIKDRLNNFTDILGTGEAYNTLKKYIISSEPPIPDEKYMFILNYQSYQITKTTEYDNYYQFKFIPSIANEFIQRYSKIIATFNESQKKMKQTYIQYAYDYTTNEINAGIDTINNSKLNYDNKKNIYDTALNEYQNSLPTTKEQNNKFIENKNKLNQTYLNTVKGIIDEQQNILQGKIKDEVKKQWTLDDEEANKLITTNVLNATQNLKNQLQSSNELSELINKQQSLLYDDVYNKNQLNKFNEGSLQFNSLDNFRTGTMHRYQDPSCNEENTYLYCQVGEIECQDVFGNIIPDLMSITKTDDYEYGNTYSKCGSLMNQTNIKDLTTDMSGVILKGNQGFYYDVDNVKCPKEQPWVVGGDDYIVPFDRCYSTEEEASNRLAMLRNYDTTDLTNDAVVYIDGDYLINEYMVNNPASKSVLYRQKTMWFENKKHFKGIIDKLDTNNLFNVYIPDKKGVLFKSIPGKYMSTLNTDYITNKKKYLGNIKNGDLPRPVCKGGTFTTKCSNKPPYNPSTGDPYVIDPVDTEQKNIEKKLTDDTKQQVISQLNTFNDFDDNNYLPSSLTTSIGYSAY